MRCVRRNVGALVILSVCFAFTTACSKDAVCGDGAVVSPEVCDDGNELLFDGCSASCIVEVGWTCVGEPSICEPICGDLLQIFPEVCEDGNTESGDGCSADCRSLEVCANGILDVGEGCDDGNRENGDGCNSACVVENVCGNGIAEPEVGEVCDGLDLLEQRCADHGWETGTLRCDATCTTLLTDGCRDVELLLTLPVTINVHSSLPFAVEAPEIYWVVSTYIMTAPLSGGPGTILVDANGIGEITLGPEAVYYGNSAVMSVPRAGGTPTAIATGDLSPRNLVTDATHAYWINHDTDEVMRVDLAGAVPEVVTTGVGEHLRIDDTHVYFTDSRSVVRAPKTGGARDVLVTTDDDIGAIALGSTRLFYAADGIFSVSLGGGAPVEVTRELSDVPALAIDSTHVFWSSDNAPRIGKVPIEGGDPVTLAEVAHCYGSLFVDATHVYWGGYGVVARVLK